MLKIAGFFAKHKSADRIFQISTNT